MDKIKKIILGVSGSIAAYKAADILRRLQAQGIKVSVIMTKEAEEFISPLTLATLSGEKVHRQMFDQNQDEWVSSHISLAQQAAAILIAPATANVISKIACGLADDLLSCTVMAARAPVFIAPAMNDAMYKDKILQSNIEKLKNYGFHFIPPVEGKLACGTTGEGHLAAVEDIVAVIVGALAGPLGNGPRNRAGSQRRKTRQ